MKKFLDQYNQVGIECGIEDADPHRLIQMLMEGVKDRIMSAKIFMHENSIAKKGETISSAITIVEALRAHLDHEKGGDISTNLDSLYQYISLQLAKANIQNDPALLDEAAQLMSEIKSAWDEIPKILAGQAKHTTNQKSSKQGVSEHV